MSLDYQSVPKGFVHCLSDKCKQKNNCIRSEAYQKLSADSRTTINIVNPKYIDDNKGEDCSFFIQKELLRYAKGMRHLFDNLQYPEAVAIKHKLITFWGRTKYYRYNRGDKLISPEEQANIKAIFVQNGLSDKIEFDQYIEQYRFD